MTKFTPRHPDPIELTSSSATDTVIIGNSIIDTAITSGANNVTMKKADPAVTYDPPFHSTGHGYWSKCKYCKETGLEFKNKHLAYCPHCRAMFRYRGE